MTKKSGAKSRDERVDLDAIDPVELAIAMLWRAMQDHGITNDRMRELAHDLVYTADASDGCDAREYRAFQACMQVNQVLCHWDAVDPGDEDRSETAMRAIELDAAAHALGQTEEYLREDVQVFDAEVDAYATSPDAAQTASLVTDAIGGLREAAERLRAAGRR